MRRPPQEREPGRGRPAGHPAGRSGLAAGPPPWWRTLTAALVASGLTAPAALASVLAYRLISFWMIMIGGWVLMIVLTRARTAPAHRYACAGGPAGPRSAAALAP